MHVRRGMCWHVGVHWRDSQTERRHGPGRGQLSGEPRPRLRGSVRAGLRGACRRFRRAARGLRWSRACGARPQPGQPDPADWPALPGGRARRRPLGSGAPDSGADPGTRGRRRRCGRADRGRRGRDECCGRASRSGRGRDERGWSRRGRGGRGQRGSGGIWSRRRRPSGPGGNLGGVGSGDVWGRRGAVPSGERAPIAERDRARDRACDHARNRTRHRARTSLAALRRPVAVPHLGGDSDLVFLAKRR